MENRVAIRAYTKVWKLENKIYAIQNIKLPIPVSPRAVGYFFVNAAVMFLLSNLLPILQRMPAVLRMGIVPFALMQFMLKKKLDGKAPHKYFAAWLHYVINRSQYIERFCAYPGGRDKTYRLSWNTGRDNWR